MNDDSPQTSTIQPTKRLVGLRRLSHELREHRRRNGHTIAAVARRCGITCPTYQAIENGHRRPRIATCYPLAAYLNLDPKEVIALAGHNLKAYTPDY